jgi:hypothetical protein
VTHTEPRRARQTVVHPVIDGSSLLVGDPISRLKRRL